MNSMGKLLTTEDDRSEHIKANIHRIIRIICEKTLNVININKILETYWETLYHEYLKYLHLQENNLVKLDYSKTNPHNNLNGCIYKFIHGEIEHEIKETGNIWWVLKLTFNVHEYLVTTDDLPPSTLILKLLPKEIEEFKKVLTIIDTNQKPYEKETKERWDNLDKSSQIVALNKLSCHPEFSEIIFSYIQERKMLPTGTIVTHIDIKIDNLDEFFISLEKYMLIYPGTSLL